LDQEGLIGIFNGARFLPDRLRQGAQTNRLTTKSHAEHLENLPVELVETQGVNTEKLQSFEGYTAMNALVTFDLSKVPHSAQQTVCDTRRAPRAQGNLMACIVIELDVQQAG